MANLRDPGVILEDYFKLLKFWHCVDAIFLWEFVTSLDFEWKIFQERRPYYPPTIWVYSLTRLAALAAVIVNLILLNASFEVDCQVSILFQMIPAYVALSASFLLMLLRINLIWNKNTIVLMIAAAAWGINGAFIIQGISRFHYVRVDAGIGCKALNVQETKVTTVVAFVTDVLLVLILLVGLVTKRYYLRDNLGLRRFLWDQGIIFLLVTTVSGILPTVFVLLNLNEPLSIIFHIPWLIAMSIAATRMYRALENALSCDIRKLCNRHGSPQGTTGATSPPNGMEAASAGHSTDGQQRDNLNVV